MREKPPVSRGLSLCCGWSFCDPERAGDGEHNECHSDSNRPHEKLRHGAIQPQRKDETEFHPRTDGAFLFPSCNFRADDGKREDGTM